MAMEYIRAFLVGGLICMLVQILMDKTKMMPGRIMVLLVVSGSVLGFWECMSVCRVGRGRSDCAAAWIWKYTLERGCEGDGGGWSAWNL